MLDIFTLQVLHVKNRSTVNQHQVKGILRVDTVTYTGVTGDGVKRHEFDMLMTPEAKEKITLLVTFNDYYKKLIDQVGLIFVEYQHSFTRYIEFILMSKIFSGIIQHSLLSNHSGQEF